MPSRVSFYSEFVVLRESCRKFISILALTLLAVAASPSFASDRPKIGTAIGKKFSLVFSAPGFEQSCEDLRDSLNQPTIFSWNLSAALLSTRDTFIWQKRQADGEWLPPRTLGEIQSHERPEGLSVDLDGDGVDEFIWRDWLEYKSQPYNELLLPSSSARGAVNAVNLLPRKALQRAIEVAGAGGSLVSSFYLLEVIAAKPRPYIIALSSIWILEHFDVPAYVVRFKRDLTPELICTLQTTVFGGP